MPFEDAAYKLKKGEIYMPVRTPYGDFSKPFKTLYGWHIIKRLDLKNPGSYEESRPLLEGKIN